MIICVPMTMLVGVEQIMRALRCAKQHRLESLPPSAFLHAAAESGVNVNCNLPSLAAAL